MPTPAVTFANLYNAQNACTYSVTGTGDITASLTGSTDGSTDSNLWLLVNISGTLSYTVTASSEPVWDGGRLYLTSSSPAAHGVNGAVNVATIAGLTNVSEPVSGVGTSTGTVAVTAGQYLVLRYRKDSEDSAYDNKITAALSVAPDVVAPQTLYYNAAVDTDWNTLGNWWTDSGFSIAASSLPTSIDSVELSAAVTTNGGSEPTVVNCSTTSSLSINITVTTMATFSGSLSYGATLTGNATFNGSAFNDGTVTNDATFNNGASQGGTVSGNATFNGAGSVNRNTVSGNAIFNDSSFNDYNGGYGIVAGNATFNDSSYNAGTVSSNATWSAAAFTTFSLGTVSGTITFSSATAVVFTTNAGNNWTYDSSFWAFTTAGPTWTFDDVSTTNSGTLNGDATFNDVSNNTGTVSGNATFNDNAYNNGGTITGNATFYGLFGNQTGTVSGNAIFYESSFNGGTVSTDAIFNDYSYNNTYGIVTGNASYNGSSSLLLIFNGDLLDSSGHHFPVTNFGASLNPSIGSSNFPPRNGVSFDGAGSWLDISHNPALNLGTTDFTIEGWINFNAVNDGDTLLSKGTANGYTLYYYAGALYMGVPYVSNDLSGPWTPTPSFWYHIAASRKDSILRLFVDGIQIAQGSNSINYATGASLRIGQTHSGTYVNAYMDDIRITADGLYTGNFSPPSSELTRIEGFSRGLLGSSVGGIARYNGLTGMSIQNVDNGIYYIGGESTPLNLDGTGYWGDKSTYYIAGFATTLDIYGNGVWNGHAYYNAVLQPTGYNGYFYYISDAETSLDSSGNGCWNNSPYSYGNRTFDPSTDTGYNSCDSLYYVSGVSTSLNSSGYGDYNGLHYSAYPTEFNGVDYNNYYYYIAGNQTTLDTGGNGVWNGNAYWGGYAQATGYNGYFYYINDVQTTLDSSGSGIWETRNYFNGNSTGQPGTDIRYMRYYGCGDLWDDVNNWQVCFSNNGPQTDWGGSTFTAGELPTSIDFCLISGYACSTPRNSYSQPVCNTLYMDSYSNDPYNWNSGYPINVVHAIIEGTSRLDIYASSETTFRGAARNYGNLTGDVIFQNSSQNYYDYNGYYNSYYDNRSGRCLSGASFYDSSSNNGDITQNWWDTTITYVYFGEVSGSQAIFWDNSTNNGKCSAGATFHNNSKNLFGITGGVTLAYDKGINGSNILGIL